MSTLLVEIPTDVTPEQRHAIKDCVGFVIREVLGTDVPVSVDHIGLPVDVSQQPTEAVVS